MTQLEEAMAEASAALSKIEILLLEYEEKYTAFFPDPVASMPASDKLKLCNALIKLESDLRQKTISEIER